MWVVPETGDSIELGDEISFAIANHLGTAGFKVLSVI